MSEEQNTQKLDNQEKQKVEQKCQYTLLIVLIILSLIVSITSLVLTATVLMNGQVVPSAQQRQAGKVVISKQYDKGRNLDKAMQTGKPVIAFFYTDWCGFCQKFVPTFDKLSKDSLIKENFAIAYINCENPANQKHVQDYEIKGFPTVFVIRNDGKRVQLENNTFFVDNAKTILRDTVLEIIKD